jgi:hypothetical protein
LEALFIALTNALVASATYGSDGWNSAAKLKRPKKGKLFLSTQISKRGKWI